MRIIQNGERLSVTELEDLAGSSSGAFQSAVGARLNSGVKQIDVDLSGTAYVDCGGIGALVALRKCARQANATATVRLLNPARQAQRLFALTQLDELFAIERTDPAGQSAIVPYRGGTPAAGALTEVRLVQEEAIPALPPAPEVATDAALA